MAINRSKRFQFSIRSLLLCVGLLAMPLSYTKYVTYTHDAQYRIVKAIEHDIENDILAAMGTKANEIGIYDDCNLSRDLKHVSYRTTREPTVGLVERCVFGKTKNSVSILRIDRSMLSVDSELSRLPELRSLKELKVDATTISKQAMTDIAKCRQLEKLQFHGLPQDNYEKLSIIECANIFAPLSQLTSISLSGDWYSKEPLSLIGHNDNLQSIKLSHMRIRDDSLLNAFSYKNLVSFVFSECSFDCNGLAFSANMIKPYSIEMYHCIISQDTLGSISSAPQLCQLYIFDSKIDDSAWVSISNTTHISEVHIAGTKLGDNFIDFAMQTPNIEWYLDDVGIDEEIIRKITKRDY